MIMLSLLIGDPQIVFRIESKTRVLPNKRLQTGISGSARNGRNLFGKQKLDETADAGAEKQARRKNENRAFRQPLFRSGS
ncbi:hypothetical protein CDO73_17435 [Saccharibacillus sp. O23]|nr:hypothetical protein CDO73_17435 [Saccharibacillus sp. O23]